ncbi:YchJ family protein [Aurantivibrio plasticivorans]
MLRNCLCDSGKVFAECCEPYLNESQVAKTPVQLMRSRYVAYALGGYGEYLLKTWFPATAQGLDAAELSQRTINWQRLEVVNKAQHGDHGTVEFNAYFLPEHADQLETMHEVSEFQRIAGRWLYVGKVVSSSSA